MEDEIWKDMPDYEGYYQVSNLGRIKSLARELNFYRE
ncbi:NUMOD4 domain-containing protein [Apibacter sp. HY039]|nr:NUMOD4 domain-containing protein [Apibacter sp. HY039]